MLAAMKESRMCAWSCLAALQDEVRNKIPAVTFQDYVDNVAQRAEHKVPSVSAEYACDAALRVAEGFEKREIKVSPRTLVVASSNMALAVTMAKLKVRGLQCEKSMSVRDLGANNAEERKGRRTATQKQRVSKMARRARRRKKLAAWNANTTALQNTHNWPTSGLWHLWPSGDIYWCFCLGWKSS